MQIMVKCDIKGMDFKDYLLNLHYYNKKDF